jgi:hypothetical protein
MTDAGGASAAQEAPPPPEAPPPATPSFDHLLMHSGSVFGVLSLADATMLYVSPNLSRVFHINLSAGQLLGRVAAHA